MLVDIEEFKKVQMDEKAIFQRKFLESIQRTFNKYKNEQRIIQEKVEIQTRNQPVKFNVGGTDFVVGKETLMQVKDSYMTSFFSGNFKKLEYDINDSKSIYLDRNPEIFRHIVEYLRVNRTFIPKDVSQDTKDLIELEIKFWGLDKGLNNFDQVTNLKAMKLQELLNTIPEIAPT